MRLITFSEAKYDLGKPDDETNGSVENDEVSSDVSPTSLLCYNFLTERDLHKYCCSDWPPHSFLSLC